MQWVWCPKMTCPPVHRVVKEEIFDDNAKLPCFNGRVVSWVSPVCTQSIHRGPDVGSLLWVEALPREVAGSALAGVGQGLRQAGCLSPHSPSTAGPGRGCSLRCRVPGHRQPYRPAPSPRADRWHWGLPAAFLPVRTLWTELPGAPKAHLRGRGWNLLRGWLPSFPMPPPWSTQPKRGPQPRWDGQRDWHRVYDQSPAGASPAPEPRGGYCGCICPALGPKSLWHPMVGPKSLLVP